MKYLCVTLVTTLWNYCHAN